MPTNADPRQMYGNCLKLLLQPIARLALRKGITFKDCSHFLKQVFVFEAARQLEDQGKKINVSRISVMSGIMRNEVNRIYSLGETSRGVEVSIPTRVIELWESDARYKRNGRLKTLTIAEFQTLVSQVSKHVNHGTVLFELVRLGNIIRKGDSLRLKRKVHKLAAEPEEAFALAAKDVDTLIECVEENLDPMVSLGNLHIRTEYDHISEKSLRVIRKWFISQGRALHKRARKFLSAHDLDLSPELVAGHRGGNKAVISMVTLTSPLSQEKTLPHD